jgi:hypothetical protein
MVGEKKILVWKSFEFNYASNAIFEHNLKNCNSIYLQAAACIQNIVVVVKKNFRQENYMVFDQK